MRFILLMILAAWCIGHAAWGSAGRPGSPLDIFRYAHEMYFKEQSEYQLFSIDVALFLHTREPRYLEEYLKGMPQPIPAYSHTKFMGVQHGLVFALSGYLDLREFCSARQRARFEDSLYACLKQATAKHWHSHGQNAHAGYVCLGTHILETSIQGKYDTRQFRAWMLENKPLGGSGTPGMPAFEHVCRVSDDAPGYAEISWINYYWNTRIYSPKPVRDTIYARAYAWWLNLTLPNGAFPHFGDTGLRGAYNQYLCRAALDLNDPSIWTVAAQSLAFMRSVSMPVDLVDYSLLYRAALHLSPGLRPCIGSVYMHGPMYAYASEALRDTAAHLGPWKSQADKIVFRDGWDPDDAYLLLDLNGGFMDQGQEILYHNHNDANAILCFAWAGKPWIVSPDYHRPSRRYHSAAMRDAFPAMEYAPEYRSQEEGYRFLKEQDVFFKAMDYTDFSLSGWENNGMGFTEKRAIVFLKNKGAVIFDYSLPAQGQADKQKLPFVSRWNMKGRVVFKNAQRTVFQQDSSRCALYTLLNDANDQVFSQELSYHNDPFYGGPINRITHAKQVMQGEQPVLTVHVLYPLRSNKEPFVREINGKDRRLLRNRGCVLTIDNLRVGCNFSGSVAEFGLFSTDAHLFTSSAGQQDIMVSFVKASAFSFVLPSRPARVLFRKYAQPAWYENRRISPETIELVSGQQWSYASNKLRVTDLPDSNGELVIVLSKEPVYTFTYGKNAGTDLEALTISGFSTEDGGAMIDAAMSIGISPNGHQASFYYNTGLQNWMKKNMVSGKTITSAVLRMRKQVDFCKAGTMQVIAGVYDARKELEEQGRIGEKQGWMNGPPDYTLPMDVSFLQGSDDTIVCQADTKPGDFVLDLSEQFKYIADHASDSASLMVVIKSFEGPGKISGKADESSASIEDQVKLEMLLRYDLP